MASRGQKRSLSKHQGMRLALARPREQRAHPLAAGERLGRRDEAAAVFGQQLELNPNDNQGVRFLLSDLEAGLTCEESARFEEGEQSRWDDDSKG